MAHAVILLCCLKLKKVLVCGRVIEVNIVSAIGSYIYHNYIYVDDSDSMPQMNIYVDEKENSNLERYMEKNKINSKLEAIRKILREIKV
jgi:hypothetical protein